MGKDKTALSLLGKTFEVDITPGWGNGGEYCGAIRVIFIFWVVS
jgi:hypothetical protein